MKRALRLATQRSGGQTPSSVRTGEAPVLHSICVFLFLLLAACEGSPTDPDDPSNRPHGRLSGLVTIGPFCPTQDCPTPPSEYSRRKILVFDATRTRQLFTVDIDSRGAYLIDLAPANYVIDFRGVGADTCRELPREISIRANLVTRVDLHIDTGLR